MRFILIGEDFGSNLTTESFDDEPVAAYNRAVELSNQHNMDFVTFLIDGFPAKKFVDGKEA